MIALNQQTLYAYLHWTKKTNVPHLKVKQPFYHTDDFREHMRRVGTPAIWSDKDGEWDYPLTPAAVTQLDRAATIFGLSIEWSDELKSYAEQQRAVDKYEEQVRLAIEKAKRDEIQLPPYPTNDFGGEKPPMRHQQLVYHWALRTTGLLVAHEPGLGKTRSATDAAGGWYRENIIRPMSNYRSSDGSPRYYHEDALYTGEFKKNGDPKKKVRNYEHWGVEGGVLIICPSGVVRTWSREFSQWQNMTALEITGSKKRKQTRSGTVAHAHIINYESLHLVMHNEYDAIIVDESHRCANNSTQTRHVLELSLSARRRILLSGSPVSNSLESVFYQMLIVDGGRSLGASHAAFVDEHFETETVGPGITKNRPIKGAVETVSAGMSRAAYFLKKTECLDLPEKFHTPVYLDMLPDQQRYYDALVKETISYIQDSTVTIEQASARMMKLLQVCQGVIKDDGGLWRHFNDVKRNTLIGDLQNELLGRKVIVWCRFTHEVDVLIQQLADRGIWALRYDGTIKSKETRNRIITAWNNDHRYTVFVAQLSMGEGIELVAEECTVPCYDTYYLGLDYRYISWIQSQDRIHRITQRYPCNYKYLLTPNGIDNRIYQSILAKHNMAEQVHDTGKDYFLKLLTDTSPTLDMVA